MVERGEIAVIHFTGRIVEDGEPGPVFETTDVDVALEEGIYHDGRDYKPLEFRVGEGKVLAGIDGAVREMAVGETRMVRLEPARAYGEYDPDRVVEVDREEIEERSDASAAKGELVGTETGDTGWITSVSDGVVEVDFNHELAGETLEFEIRLLATRDDGVGE